MKNSEWIKCGLCWSVEGQPEDLPKKPNLNRRERKVFGTCRKDEFEKVKDVWDKYREMRLDFLGPEFNESIAKKKLVDLNDPDINRVLEYNNFNEKASDWHSDQPEVKEYWNNYYKIEDEYRNNCFRNKFAKPGILIELEDGKQMLIGHINKNGGVCDDCVGIEPEDVIKRYKVVYGCDE